MELYKEDGLRTGDANIGRSLVQELEKTGTTTIKTYNNDEKIQCVSLYDRCLNDWTALRCLN